MADPTVESAEKSTPKFDPEYKFVTSYAFSPTILAGIRLLLALFTLVTLLFTLIWQGVKEDDAETWVVVHSSPYFASMANETIFSP